MDFTKEKEIGLTADGEKWWQICYICKKQINFLKDPSASKWLRVGDLIRHKKCRPAPAK